MAEIFVVSTLGMLCEVAGNPSMGATLCRAGGRYGDVFFLSESIDGQLLAGDRLRLVLSFDSFFCSLAGFPNGPGSILAAMDFLAG